MPNRKNLGRRERSAGERHQTEVRPNLLRRMNERRILETIQDERELSRADLVRTTGISPPTVSKLVRSLLDAGLLEEGDALTEVPGRPAKILRLANDGVGLLGAVVDIKQCSIAATGLNGELSDDRTLHFRTPGTYDELIAALANAARRLVPKSARTLALGLSVPGLIDRRHGQVLLSANIHQLNGQYPARDLAEQTGMKVVLLHETDALCLGERAFGQARGMDDFTLIDATGGLGAAIMTGGRLISGQSGMAGEIGHITVAPHGRRCGCGNVGCLETVASDLAFALLISDKIGETVDMQRAVELVQSGSVSACDEIESTIRYLAIGVAAVINIFNPGAVFLRTRLLDVRDDAFDELREQVRQRSLGPSYVDCSLHRATGSKLQSAVAGTIDHLAGVVGPKV